MDAAQVPRTPLHPLIPPNCFRTYLKAWSEKAVAVIADCNGFFLFRTAAILRWKYAVQIGLRSADFLNPEQPD